MPGRDVHKNAACLAVLCLAAALTLHARDATQDSQDASKAVLAATGGLTPNLDATIARPLRYRPDDTDFVIEDGQEFFNRPLYGGNTAFRVDAGDRPEFTLYLPGRGGNLRLGLARAGMAKWLHQAGRVVSRYRPGSMLYDVQDPLLGDGARLHVTVLATVKTEGLVLRVVPEAVATGAELLFAYGGVTGQRGQRDGDIGTEKVPIGQYFQLQPDFCRGNVFTVSGSGFTLRSKAATIAGQAPTGSTLSVGDATKWDSAPDLLASPGGTQTPVVVGRVPITAGRPLLLALQRLTDATARLSPDDPAATFSETERHFGRLRRQVVVDTPDAYVNASAAALNVAADGWWDEPSGTVQHGAVAWRTKLLGWRGPYAMDALGWHDRARRHFTYWAGRQNTDPIPLALPPPDTSSNLARSEAALHSNGDLSNSHYDMNLVYIDAVFRHLLWTGDLEFARSVWPVVERHLAWERRLFRRTFGPDHLPLYEAYAAIWASDDLEYHGGGVTHASAYNHFHNRMAGRIARLLGTDASPYDQEADAIAKAMRTFLWMDDAGSFGEFKDLLGRQLTHPSAGLWTFYHALDSGVTTPREAWRMSAFVDDTLPHLPVRGPGVPGDQRHEVLATTNWMPYTWSVNNVVMGENVHAALGYWQAGRADDAFRLLKSALLASMYMGICPGNVGSMSYLDAYRRESQRDFADPGGVLARALVEGLFGVRPDALAGTLVLEPGFPSAWCRARLQHPDLDVLFRRQGPHDTYVVEGRFARALSLELRVTARFDRVASVTVNGRPAVWRGVEDAVAIPRIEIRGPAAAHHEVQITWSGSPIGFNPAIPSTGRYAESSGDRGSRSEDRFEERRQGQMRWWAPRARLSPRAATNAAQQPSPDFWKTPPSSPETWDPVDLRAHFNDRVTAIFARGKYVSPRSPFASLAIPAQGIGGWAGSVNAMAEIDDGGLRAAAASSGGRIVLPNGVPFSTPGPGQAPNVVFTSQWDNYPREATIPLAGTARRLFLLVAGSTNWMQSRIDNGEIVVAYGDGTTDRLALHNPTTWWPIDQDYFVDDFAFSGPCMVPRVDLATGTVRILDLETFKGKGRVVPGGAATVLVLDLRPQRALRSLTVRALANEVVVGVMAATLQR
jgi:hypothetical protein